MARGGKKNSLKNSWIGLDYQQNLMGSSVAHAPPFHRLFWKSAEQLLRNPADEQNKKWKHNFLVAGVAYIQQWKTIGRAEAIIRSQSPMVNTKIVVTTW